MDVGAVSNVSRDRETAISKLAKGLQGDYPNAKVDVVFLYKKLPATEACSVASIGPVLERVCRGFRSPNVQYHPGNPYGFVAEVRANGEENESGEIKRRRLRPRVVVLVTEIDGKDIPVGQAPEGYRAADGGDPIDFGDD